MPRRRNRIGVAAALLGIAGLAALALVVHHKAQPKHLRTVTPGVLYRSGLLRPSNFERVVDDYAVRTVVNLLPSESLSGERQRDWESERQSARERGIRIVEIPMLAETPPTSEQVDRWNALFDAPENLPLLVHCEYGVVRTGMMVAVYEMERLGLSGPAALEAMPSFGHDLEAPKRRAMREFILDYTPRSAKAGAP